MLVAITSTKFFFEGGQKMPAKRSKKRVADKQRVAVDQSYFNANISDDEVYDYVLIARQLCYPKSVQDAIMAAESDLQCERILRDAREKYF